MSNLATTKDIKSFFGQDNIKAKFQEMLGKRAPQFITSVLQIVANNSYLSSADPLSIYNCAATAATLDLPLNNNLGFAWIVPYGKQAQFQMGWRGYVQLAQRTGQYLKINVVEVYANQFRGWDTLREKLDADFALPPSGSVVGYCAYFMLINGFEKVVYWDIEKVKAHAKKYSKSWNNGPWKDEFDKMAKKTVLKDMLSKWGMMSVEIQKALVVDQAVIQDADATEVQYPDNPDTAEPIPTFEDLELLYDIKKQSLGADEKQDAERILSNKEEKSYKKLQTLLAAK